MNPDDPKPPEKNVRERLEESAKEMEKNVERLDETIRKVEEKGKEAETICGWPTA
jgi:hypothetical protein